MKESTRQLLRCVASAGDSVCMGNLQLVEGPEPVLMGAEIREGVLTCGTCGMAYPIIAGVAIVLENPYRYLREGYSLVKGLVLDVGGMSKQLEMWLYKRMLSDVKSKDEKLFPRKIPYNARTTHPMHKWLGTYVMSHYLAPVTTGNELLDRLLALNHENGPLAILQAMAATWASADAVLAVDLGCSVGGLTNRLAPHAKQAVGMDLSFEKVLTARQISVGQPTSVRETRLYREGTNFESVPLRARTVENVDFLVASGDRVPLSSDAVDVVSSCNLVDVIADPFRLLAEKRRLTVHGGIILLSTPYLDHSPAVVNHLAAETSDPKTTIRKSLNGFEILDERDKVPWLLRASDRHYDVYLDHCLVARRIRHSA